MSINRNRCSTEKCTQNRWYKITDLKWKNSPWDDYGWNFHHGNMPNHKWREYKTWKYNRKNSYKE